MWTDYKIPDDYSLHYMPFPGDILACVRLDKDGYPTIYINDFLSPPAKQEALKHELLHFERGDFFSHYTIFDVERLATQEIGLSTMFRSARQMTADERLEADINGIKLMIDFGIGCELWEPSGLPHPVFDAVPDRFILKKNKQFIGVLRGLWMKG